MSTLLLRLAGPMQSWGTQSRFRVRDSGLEPSKSGVVGLLCAALGWPRDCDLSSFSRLRMGVRVNREGFMRRDYHTAGGGRINGQPYGVIKASGARGDTVLSDRYYLADADFLVGLEGDDGDLLRKLDDALMNPHWQVFLGRKSFLPSVPVWLRNGGLRPNELRTTLQDEPWHYRSSREKDELLKNPRLRLVIEQDDPSSGEVRQDTPLCFAERKFTLRYVKTTIFDLSPEWIAERVKEDDLCKEDGLCTSPS